MDFSGTAVRFFQKAENGAGKRIFLPLLRKYRANRYPELEGMSLITSNCIGGVLSHAYRLRFNSPTVNLYMDASDYVSFVENLEENLRAHVLPCGAGGEGGYPMGRIGEITLHFVHYKDFRSAEAKWAERVGRVDLSKVVLILCERDGCGPETVERFARLPYPKILLSKTRYPYPFAFIVEPTRYERRMHLDPMDRLMEFGSWGRRRFERIITPNVLLTLIRESR